MLPWPLFKFFQLDARVKVEKTPLPHKGITPFKMLTVSLIGSEKSIQHWTYMGIKKEFLSHLSHFEISVITIYTIC
jgi:hypothetical protein